MAIAAQVAVAEVIRQDDDHIRMPARLSGISSLITPTDEQSNCQDQQGAKFGHAPRSHNRMNADLRGEAKWRGFSLKGRSVIEVRNGRPIKQARVEKSPERCGGRRLNNPAALRATGFIRRPACGKLMGRNLPAIIAGHGLPADALCSLGG
jgi:hypothetical protein